MAIFPIVIAFVLLGISSEVIRTAVLDFIKTKDPKLTGQTYLWMIPIYATVPFIYMFILSQFPHIHILMRATLYMFSFYLLEYIAGHIIKKLVGIVPRNYHHYKIKLFSKTYKSNIQ